jgi:hypothetical protein
MVNTRSHNANAENNDVVNKNAESNDDENNNIANPPPPPTLEQVVVMQAQILQTMQQALANIQQNQQAPQP